MTRVGERGSIVGFIVGGVLLTALVIGGIWTIRNIGQPAEVAVEQTAEEQGSDEAEQEDTTTERNEDEAERVEENETEQGTSEQTDERSGEEGNTGTSDQEGQDQPDSLAQTGQELPQTGPSDVVATGAVVAILVGAALAYRRSLQL